MLLKNATAYIDGKFRHMIDVRTEENLIVEIGENLPILPGEETQNINEDYLLPGFVDVHIHAFGGMDTMDGEKAVRHMSRELKKQGVSAFLPTTMSASLQDTLSALKGIDAVRRNPEKDGAVVIGAHMEAPFLSKERRGAQVADYFTPPSMNAWHELTGAFSSVARIVTMAPELDGAQEWIREIASRGIVVSIGHTNASCELVHQAASWGATHVTHLFNAQTPLHHREPGVPGATLTDSRLYAELICDGIHLHPDIIRLTWLCKGREKAILVTDAMEAAGMPDGTYSLGGQTVHVKDGAARLSSGTLAGSTLTMPKGFQNLIHIGIPPEDAVYMATQGPAESIGEKLAGRIVKGAPGIFTRWDSAWNLKAVIG